MEFENNLSSEIADNTEFESEKEVDHIDVSLLNVGDRVKITGTYPTEVEVVKKLEDKLKVRVYGMTDQTKEPMTLTAELSQNFGKTDFVLKDREEREKVGEESTYHWILKLEHLKYAHDTHFWKKGNKHARESGTPIGKDSKILYIPKLVEDSY